VALYVGGGNFFIAEYPRTNNSSNLREVLIRWNPVEKENFVPSIINFEIELTLEDGTKKISKVHPIMLNRTLDYDATIRGKALKFFTNAVFEDIQNLDLNFAY
jgi:hypothetical protein